MKRTVFAFGVVLLFFVACKMTTNHSSTKPRKSKNSIPENALIDLVITSIDTTSPGLYDLVRFYYKKPKNIGIILKKSLPLKYILSIKN